MRKLILVYAICICHKAVFLLYLEILNFIVFTAFNNQFYSSFIILYTPSKLTHMDFEHMTIHLLVENNDTSKFFCFFYIYLFIYLLIFFLFLFFCFFLGFFPCQLRLIFANKCFHSSMIEDGNAHHHLCLHRWYFISLYSCFIDGLPVPSS